MLTQLARFVMACSVAGAAGAAATETNTRALDFDFSPLSLHQAEHDRIARPLVTWEVSNSPFMRCTQLSTHQHQRRYSTACVVWNEDQSTCHIVTTSRTTHVQLGQLLVSCMRKPS